MEYPILSYDIRMINFAQHQPYYHYAVCMQCIYPMLLLTYVIKETKNALVLQCNKMTKVVRIFVHVSFLCLRGEAIKHKPV